MAVMIIKFLCVLLFLTLVGKCYGQCSLDNITISQAPTGFQIHGKTQYNATIANECHCTQYSVKLDCNGFETTESIDPSILSVSGSECLVNNGAPIFDTSPINFTYAWDPAFQFKPLFSEIACS